MRLKHQLLRTAVVWVALSGLLFLFNPNHMPVLLLVAPFVLLYFACYELWLLLAVAWQRLARGKQRPEEDLRQSGKFLSIFITFIAILGSLGQLVARDILTLFLLFAIGYFYVVRARRRRSNN